MGDWRQVLIRASTHKRLRLLSALEGRPMTAIIEEALTTGPVGERLERIDPAGFKAPVGSCASVECGRSAG